MFTIQAGNPVSKPVTITYKRSGLPYDLTDKIILFTVKKLSDKTRNDDLAVIKGSILTHTDPELGKTLLEINEQDTNIPAGLYKGDFRIYRDTPHVKLNTRVFDVLVENVVTERTE